MNTLEWDTIVQAIAEYRACPERVQLDSLCRALTGCTLYVPAGDFDGNNAVISLLSSAQGGLFIPLYATKENVCPPQHSEGVRPADWKHILSQMPFVDGYVIEPYSVNFAFDGRLIDAILGCGASGVADCDGGTFEGEALDGGTSEGEVVEGGADDSVPEADVSSEVDAPEVEGAVEYEAHEADVPVVHAWPPAHSGETETPVVQDSPDEGDSEAECCDEEQEAHSNSATQNAPQHDQKNTQSFFRRLFKR